MFVTEAHLFLVLQLSARKDSHSPECSTEVKKAMSLTVGSNANTLPFLLFSPSLAAKSLTEMKFQIIKRSLLLHNNISYFSLETA
jgi:hypothetical protein